MSDFLKRAAVRLLKPRLSPTQWDRLRGHREPPPRPSLTHIATRTGTDKWGVHFYTPHYETHLGHLRDEEFVLLEIGVGGYARDQQGGASLRMWKRYFPKAQVVGLDIEDKSFLDRPRITTVQADQTDPAALRGVLDRFGVPRVVIDDGSHRPDDIVATFEVLFPLLPSGAYYAIEDTQTSYWPEFGGQEDPAAAGTTMAFVKGLVDGLNHEEFLDPSYAPSYTDLNVRAVHCYHNLVVIEKGDNREGTNKQVVLKKRFRARARAQSTSSVDAQAPVTETSP